MINSGDQTNLLKQLKIQPIAIAVGVNFNFRFYHSGIIT